jgi:hypothetical protein
MFEICMQTELSMDISKIIQEYKSVDDTYNVFQKVKTFP